MKITALIAISLALLSGDSRAADLSATGQLIEAAGAAQTNLRVQKMTTGISKESSPSDEVSFVDLTGNKALGCFYPFELDIANKHRSIIISDDVSYQDLLNHNEMECKNPKLVPIDFSKNVLLGIMTAIEGPDQTTYIRTVRKDDQKSKITYLVKATATGRCDDCLDTSMNWVLIPKQPDGYTFDIWASENR